VCVLCVCVCVVFVCVCGVCVCVCGVCVCGVYVCVCGVYVCVCVCVYIRTGSHRSLPLPNMTPYWFCNLFGHDAMTFFIFICIGEKEGTNKVVLMGLYFSYL